MSGSDSITVLGRPVSALQGVINVETKTGKNMHVMSE